MQKDAERLMMAQDAVMRLANTSEAMSRVEIFQVSRKDSSSSSWQYKFLSDMVVGGYLKKTEVAKSSIQKFIPVTDKINELLNMSNGVRGVLWPSLKVLDEEIFDSNEEAPSSNKESVTSASDQVRLVIEKFTNSLNDFNSVIDRFDQRLSRVESAVNSVREDKSSLYVKEASGYVADVARAIRENNEYILRTNKNLIEEINIFTKETVEILKSETGRIGESVYKIALYVSAPDKRAFNLGLTPPQQDIKNNVSILKK